MQTERMSQVDVGSMNALTLRLSLPLSPATAHFLQSFHFVAFRFDIDIRENPSRRTFWKKI